MINDIILNLEQQGFRFAPSCRNGIDRFDYFAPGVLTEKQTEMLIVLKQDEKAVCHYLIDRAKRMLDECRKAIKSTIREGRQLATMGVLTEYIRAAMQKAVLEQLSDGSWYASIPPCQGVWANEKTPEKCKVTLREVLEEWLLLKLIDNDPLEEIDGVGLTMEGGSV